MTFMEVLRKEEASPAIAQNTQVVETKTTKPADTLTKLLREYGLNGHSVRSKKLIKILHSEGFFHRKSTSRIQDFLFHGKSIPNDFKKLIVEPNATWDKESEGEIGVPSFSDDGGESWSYSNQLAYLGVTAHNISFDGDWIYLSTDQGLFISQDAEFWEKFDYFVDYQTGAQILSETIYDAKIINDRLWVATNDGIAISSENTDENPIEWLSTEDPRDWLVYRFWESDNSFSAYPNPFLINDHNVLNNQGHVRFVHTSQNSQARIDIFDFSMDKVVSLNSPNLINDQIEFVWSGQTAYGDKVKNGVYFCRFNDNGKYLWVKLAVLGTL